MIHFLIMPKKIFYFSLHLSVSYPQLQSQYWMAQVLASLITHTHPKPTSSLLK